MMFPLYGRPGTIAYLAGMLTSQGAHYALFTIEPAHAYVAVEAT